MQNNFANRSGVTQFARQAVQIAKSPSPSRKRRSSFHENPQKSGALWDNHSRAPKTRRSRQISPESNEFGFPLRSLMESGDANIDWLVEPIIPTGGAVEMFGRPGSRKTFLGMQFMMSVVTGLPFLNKYPVKRQGDALFVQAELTDSELRQRFAPLVAVYPELLDHVWMPNGMYANIDLPEHWALIERIVRERKPSIAIFDPLSLMMSGNPNEQQDMLRLLKRLNELRFNHGVTVVLIHHPRKTRFDNEGDAIGGGMEDSGGSRAVIEWAGSIVRLYRAGKSDKQKLIFEKGRAQDLPDLDVVWDDEAKLFKLTTEHEAVSENVAAVSIIPPDGMTASEWHAKMQRILGVSRSKTQTLLHQMVEDGRIAFSDASRRTIRGVTNARVSN